MQSSTRHQFDEELSTYHSVKGSVMHGLVWRGVSTFLETEAEFCHSNAMSLCRRRSTIRQHAAAKSSSTALLTMHAESATKTEHASGSTTGDTDPRHDDGHLNATSSAECRPGS